MNKFAKGIIFTLSIALMVSLGSCVVVAAGNVKTTTSNDEQARIDLLASIASPDLPAEERADILVSKMTLDQKIRFIGGYKGFFTAPIENLGIRSMKMKDASQGIRASGRSTAFPGAVCYASSWNRALTYDVGRVIGEEGRAKGVDILLGPGTNIQRIPTNGRNYEYFGEDPYLAGEMASQFIKGLQDQGVMGCIKHFVANNADNDRHRMNSVVGERALHEIYFPAFKAAIDKADVKTLMSSYNPVNGISASENKYLLTDIVKEEWGFKYMVIADWISVYNTYEPFVAGLDLEMPRGQYFSKRKIMPLLEAGKVTEAQLNDKVKRILLPALEMGTFDRQQEDSSFTEFGGEHDEVALKVAEEGIVLLKNQEKVLPLDRKKIKNLVVIGPNAGSTPTGCGGAGWVIAHNPVDFYDGIKAAAGDGVNVRLVTSSDVVAIKKADAAIVCVGWNTISEEEYLDRSWKMPSTQIAMIKRVARHNPNTIVTVTCGGGFETASWVDEIEALVHVFYLGQSSGNSFAKILFGDISPSGHLPFTMAKNWEDHPGTANYLKKGMLLRLLPGLPLMGSKGLRRIWDCNYEEGIFVGYRHFITNKVESAFAFGHGLSYSDFEISDLKVSKESFTSNDTLAVSVKVTNIGQVEAAEVVQLYVHDLESSVIRPEMELKDFGKVFLEPGESAEMTFELKAGAFSFYDVETKSWKAEPGQFEIRAAHSSIEIAQVKTVTLN